MSANSGARIVIATQSVEGNPPALRLLKICSEFGPVAVVTPHAGPGAADGVSFQRIVIAKERFYRAVRVVCRLAGRVLPGRIRKTWIEGFAEDALGLRSQGRAFAKAWRAHALKPELLILDGAEFMTSALNMAQTAGVKLLYYVHEMFPDQCAHYSPLLTARLCALERRGCRMACRIIVQHRLWGKLLRRRYHLPEEKFIEVTPSADPQTPLPGSAEDEPLRLYYHGIYTPGRGLEVLIEGVALVPGVILEMRGLGSYEKELRKLAAQTGAGDRIRFLEPVSPDQLPGSARAYDLGVMTGTREHLNGRMAAGMKLYQNISAGIPLFGYRAVTVRNFVRRHGIGFAYDGSSPEKVAETLRYCATHRPEVRAARGRTVQAAREYFNSETQYERLRQVVKTALENRS